MTPDMTVIEEIAAERQRQKDVEGWTPEHDDAHDGGELLSAAVIYLWHGTEKAAPLNDAGVPVSWPWESEWWKPKGRRRNLIRAGALCLAEMDRLKRRADKENRRLAIMDKGPYPPHTAHVDHKLDLIVAEIERLDRAAKKEG